MRLRSNNLSPGGEGRAEGGVRVFCGVAADEAGLVQRPIDNRARFEPLSRGIPEISRFSAPTDGVPRGQVAGGSPSQSTPPSRYSGRPTGLWENTNETFRPFWLLSRSRGVHHGDCRCRCALAFEPRLARFEDLFGTAADRDRAERRRADQPLDDAAGHARHDADRGTPAGRAAGRPVRWRPRPARRPCRSVCLAPG